MQAVRESGAKQDHGKTNLKKLEKSSWQMRLTVINLKSCVMNGESLEHNTTSKKFEKTWKKFLTNLKRCGNI